jgi:hypothetical protein
MLLTNTLGVKLAFSALLISTSSIICDSESPPSSFEHQIILTFFRVLSYTFGDLYVNNIKLKYIIYFCEALFSMSYCVFGQESQ